MANVVQGKSSNKKQTIRVKVDDYELRKLLATFGRMDDIAKNDMKKIANDLSERAAKFVTSYAYNAPNPAQADAIMKSLKISKSDKAPNFTIGGTKKVTQSGTSAGTLLFGTEFGSKRFRQFPPRSRPKGRGNRGWFIFIALERFQPTITKEWLQGYEKIATAWKSRAA
jgi:hypothetical protein